MQIESLDDLLVAAGEAPPESRIEFRDRIASYGREAIARLMNPAWVGDPKYAPFAVRTIAQAAAYGAPQEAVDALRRALAEVNTETQRADIAAALATLGAKKPKRSRRSPQAPRIRSTALTLGDLVEGRCYSRSELHDSLGGNRQKGISYPADGYHCLLFSDPSRASEHGYADAPVGDDGYRYFGEWSGPGDMTMTGGNQVVLDRSPELYLFTKATCGHVFRGRFQCGDFEAEKATRDGRSHSAIVFNLLRVQA